MSEQEIKKGLEELVFDRVSTSDIKFIIRDNENELGSPGVIITFSHKPSQADPLGQRLHLGWIAYGDDGVEYKARNAVKELPSGDRFLWRVSEYIAAFVASSMDGVKPVNKSVTPEQIEKELLNYLLNNLYKET